MKIQSKIALLSIPVLMAVTSTTFATTCPNPCEVTNSTDPYVNLKSTTGQDWYLWNDISSTTDSEFKIGAFGLTNSFIIDDDASNNTMYIGSGGRLGINTKTLSEEVTINSYRPGIRLNDTSTDAWDFNLVADFNNFALEDAGGNNIILAEGNNSTLPLYLDSDGDVGIQIANPVADLTVGGNGTFLLQNPAVANKDWGVNLGYFGYWLGYGNNTPTGIAVLKLGNTAPADSIVATSVGVGMGTSSPTAPLHVANTATQMLLLQNTATTNAIRRVMKMSNQGPVGFEMEDRTLARTWQFRSDGGGNFIINQPAHAGPEFQVLDNGNAIVKGDIIVSGTKLNVPDYVFAKDYKLMQLDELQEFVTKHKHLPNVPSEAYIKKEKMVSLGKSQMTHLEKIEELTLYTLQQHQQIKAMQEKIAENSALKERLDSFKTVNVKLQDRLVSLEKLVTNLASSADNLDDNGEKVALVK